MACIPFLRGSTTPSIIWLCTHQSISDLIDSTSTSSPLTSLLLRAPPQSKPPLLTTEQMQDLSHWPRKSVSIQLSFDHLKPCTPCFLLLKVLHWLLIAVRIKAQHAAMATSSTGFSPAYLSTVTMSESSHQGPSHIGLLWAPPKNPHWLCLRPLHQVSLGLEFSSSYSHMYGFLSLRS